MATSTTAPAAARIAKAVAAAERAVRASEMFRDAPKGLEALSFHLGAVLYQGEAAGPLQWAANYAGAQAELHLPAFSNPFLTEAQLEAERMNRLRRLQGIVFGALVVSLSE